MFHECGIGLNRKGTKTKKFKGLLTKNYSVFRKNYYLNRCKNLTVWELKVI